MGQVQRFPRQGDSLPVVADGVLHQGESSKGVGESELIVRPSTDRDRLVEMRCCSGLVSVLVSEQPETVVRS